MSSYIQNDFKRQMSQRNVDLKSMASLYVRNKDKAMTEKNLIFKAVALPKKTEATPHLTTLNAQQIVELDSTLEQHYPGYEVKIKVIETSTDTANVKKGSKSENLKRNSGYYITFANDVFHYYKTGDMNRYNDDVWKFTAPFPPVLREGFVVINREVYLVTLEDLKRRLVRKSRKLKLKKGPLKYEDFANGNAFIRQQIGNTARPDKNGNVAKTTDTTTAGAKTDDTSSKAGAEGAGSPGKETRISDIPVEELLRAAWSKEESGTGASAKMDESQIIDLAVKQQIGALLHHAFEEEGDSGSEWEIQNDL